MGQVGPPDLEGLGDYMTDWLVEVLEGGRPLMHGEKEGWIAKMGLPGGTEVGWVMVGGEEVMGGEEEVMGGEEVGVGGEVIPG